MKPLESAGGDGVPRGNAPRGARTLLVSLLLLAIDLGYARSLDGELQFDDLRLLRENLPIKDLAHYGPQFLAELRIAGRALTYLTFAVNYRLGGLQVRGYHLVNLAVHLLAVLAVLALGLRMLRQVRWPAPFATALLAAALFGLHPIQSEAVSYIFQRAELLGSLFYLLTVLLALRAWERGRSGLAAYGGAVFCFFLGWCSKPMVATLPAALLLLLATFPPPGLAEKPLRDRAVPLLLFSLPLWAMTLFFSSSLFGGLRGSKEAGFSVPAMSVQQYALTQPRVILTYLRLLAWPSGQNLDWDFAPSATFFEARTVLAFAAVFCLLAVAAWLLLWSSRKAGDAELRTLARLSGFGLLWFFLLLSPTSSVVPLADLILEHRVYLACWGLFLPAAAAGMLLFRRIAKGRGGALAGSAVATAVCLTLLLALHQRNAVWETEVGLWSDVVAKSPGKPRGHLNLAYALLAVDPERALAELAIVEQTSPDDNLKLVSRQEGAEILTNLAVDSLKAGERDQARTLASRAVDKWPAYGPAWHMLGHLDTLVHDYRSAASHFGRAVALEPDSAALLTRLALAQEMLGDQPAACASWARAARTGKAGAAASASEAMARLGCPSR